MRKLILLLLFVPFVCFGQENRPIIGYGLIPVFINVSIEKLKPSFVLQNKRQKRRVKIIRRNTDPTAYWDAKTKTVLSSTGEILSPKPKQPPLIELAKDNTQDLVNPSVDIPQALKKYLGYVPEKVFLDRRDYIKSIIATGFTSEEISKKTKEWEKRKQDGYFDSGKRLIISGVNIQAINQYQISDMIAFFMLDCKSKGININQDQTITSVFESLGTNVVARAIDMNDDNSITIKVDPTQWSESNRIQRWYIIYHELGHDVFNLNHGNGGKMMFNFSPGLDYTWDEFYEDKEFMLSIFKP